ncbi:DUF3850 domain-containing protein [Paraburkholderia dipogonis]|uniref:DUF3850 domain-containing protein n=1 Tax=Paraburkholderia dipogonis TaxID=1211383 RepID=A0A4Y8MJ03_9BURK|nr:DUF3850 domain-containing protein [Paraburkholderia dipogonis]
MPNTTHTLKSWPRFFEAIVRGSRTHELRKNDRDFHVGDRLTLQEFDVSSGAFTGRECMVEVTSMTSTLEPCAVSAQALHQDYCILSIRLVSPSP